MKRDEKTVRQASSQLLLLLLLSPEISFDADDHGRRFHHQKHIIPKGRIFRASS